MATPSRNEELCRISEGLYTLVNFEIGQESEVRTRRQICDIVSIFDSCKIDRIFIPIISGSTAEGFHFISSDIDFMYINKEALVVDTELRNFSYNARFPIVFLMETYNVPPGFTLLKCIRYDHGDSRLQDHKICQTLLFRGTDLYMSSERARQINLNSGKTTEHGPCRSGAWYGLEYDCAYTLKCPFWPKDAHSFIQRSICNGWPTTNELQDICKEGVLVVPISSNKRSLSDNANLQWRISFSLAEKKLVYSMNHCQFLCCGLMKIFFNEVLKEIPETKTETGNVLCSYFMKTAVFWEISECGNDWSDRNFLNKFLNVFSRVIKWVEDGYCPNFFIPENNMFYGKIYGRRQRDLMLRLRSLYNEGIQCLFRCSSVRGMLSMMLNDRFKFDLAQMLVADDLAPRKEKTVIRMLTVALTGTINTYDISDTMKRLCFTASLIPDSAETLSAIKLRVNHLLQILTIKSGFQNLTPNKLQYLSTKRARSILRKAKTSHCLNTIHQAVISYMNGEYHKTIKIVHHIQQRLQNQPYNYEWNINGAFIMGCRHRGMSYEKIFKTFIITEYVYDPVISFPELSFESIVLVQKYAAIFHFIPPLVFLYFLVILSYTRLNKPIERKAALGELHSMLYHDISHYNEIRLKAISWEILGICQQICGDYDGAYQSYLNALNDKYSEFKEATIIRILILLFELSYSRA